MSKVYLVGGAVRDKLLNRRSNDFDYVVVGSSVEEMIRVGFQQVGSSFPVFLHPVTRCEYALARTERKVGTGHRGFECDFGEDITLLEDLGRRDLTVNSMAWGERGLIDPYNGASDIKAKVLRHTTEAFSNDPLRYYDLLGFTPN